MADSKQAPLDSAAAAKAAFASVQGKPFPNDIFTAPELRWAVIGCGVIANQMAQSLALAAASLRASLTAPYPSSSFCRSVWHRKGL